jgi:AAA+ superfamily predicted ATPase
VRDADVNLYDRDRLAGEFGLFIGQPGPDGTAVAEQDIVGSTYRQVLAETTAIIGHQWAHNISRSAVKGFLFHGGVGIGKTTMARRLAYELTRIASELPAGTTHEHDGTVHQHSENDEIVCVIVDGADIARGRYGDSEEQLRKLFAYAREGEFHGNRHEDEAVRRTVLLFDDVESLFLARSSGGAKEWHFSQNSVFFHAVDELDTSRTAVILTTNRIDLLDEAIVDRFLPYEFGTPPPDVLEEVARQRARLQHLDESALAPILQAIHDPAQPVKSIREVERQVTRAYINSILKTPHLTGER